MGERITKKRILKRGIELEFEYKPRDGKNQMRESLIGFFTPDAQGELIVTRGEKKRLIWYEVEKFSTKDINVHSRIKCLLEIICADPFFKTPEKIGVPIMTLTGGWRWPFRLPFGLKGYGMLKKNIYNAGHVNAPVEIYFRGPALNPKIVNHRTGQYIRLTKELTTDDILYINTEYGKKTVEIRTGEQIEDGWDYLDLSSDFWWLLTGDNLIEYMSEGVALKSKGVEVYYRERYFGI